jgi:DNA-binding MarR family transcriptional regulator
MNQKMNRWVDDEATPAAPHFTDKQGQYLAFIWAYAQINGRAPAERDLQGYFRVSPPSVHQMVLTLEGAGLIRRTPGQARSIELCVDPRTLPVLGLPQLVKSSVQRY